MVKDQRPVILEVMLKFRPQSTCSSTRFSSTVDQAFTDAKIFCGRSACDTNARALRWIMFRVPFYCQSF